MATKKLSISYFYDDNQSKTGSFTISNPVDNVTSTMAQDFLTAYSAGSGSDVTLKKLTYVTTDEEVVFPTDD